LRLRREQRATGRRQPRNLPREVLIGAVECLRRRAVLALCCGHITRNVRNILRGTALHDVPNDASASADDATGDSAQSLTKRAASQSDNLFGLAVRCNVTKEIDVTLGYASIDGDGAFSLSAGYNF
jgi:hypothetical protein